MDNWIKYLIEILCIFIGAVCAFKYNLRIEKIKYKQNCINKVDELYHLLELLFGDLQSLKNNIETTLDGSEIYFATADVSMLQENEYHFLGSYNPYLTSLLHKLVLSYKNFRQTIEEYNQQMRTYTNQQISIATTGVDFNTIKKNHLEVIKTMLIIISILQINILKYKIYVHKINSLSHYVLAIENRLKEIYPNYADENIYNLWNNAFNSIKHCHTNLHCFICKRKECIKNFLSNLLDWFKKPQFCIKNDYKLSKK